MTDLDLDVESRLSKLETQQEVTTKVLDDLKQNLTNSLNNYQERVWGLIGNLTKIIMVLIGVIVLFAGLKITGLLDFLK